MLAADDDADLDLVDLCLAGDVDVAWTGTVRPRITKWADDTAPGARDLAALAADDRFREPLADSTVSAIRDGGARLNQILATAGLRSALTGWLHAVAAMTPADPTALGLRWFVDRVAWVSTPATAALEPDAVRRIAAADVAAGLVRTLRTGLLAEFVWPALSEVRKELPRNVTFGGSWPHLVAYSDKNVVVLGPNGVVLRHVWPKAARSWWRQAAAWVPGVDRLLLWGWEKAYWADAPGDILETDAASLKKARGLPLPGGGVTFGAKPWRPGDAEFPDTEAVISDGTGYFVLREVGDVRRWQPFDPATGVVGAGDPPRFLAVDGADHRFCDLVPAPEQFAGSPLGYADGLVGFRVVERADGSRVGTRIDGRDVAYPASATGSTRLVGGLIFPGTDTPCPVTSGRPGSGQRQITVHTPAGDQPLASETPGRDLPPTDWWHAWQVRDPAGSAALRAAGAGTVRALLDAAVAAVAEDARQAPGRAGEAAVAAAEKALSAAIVAAVADALPGITSSRLRKAVAGKVRDAADLTLRLRALGDLADGGPADAAMPAEPAAVTIDTAALATVLDGLDQHSWINNNDVNGAAAQVAAAPAVFAGTATRPAWPDTDLDWAVLLSHQDQLALRALSPVASEARTARRHDDAGDGGPERVDRARRHHPGGPRDRRQEGVRRSPGDPHRAAHHADRGQARLRGHPHVHGRGPRPGRRVRSDRGRKDQRRVAGRLGWSRSDRGPDREAGGGRAAAVAPGGRRRPRRPYRHGPGDGHPPARRAAGGSTGTRPTSCRRRSGLRWGCPRRRPRSGREVLDSIGAKRRRRLRAAMLPADIADLWTTGPDVARVAALWLELFGERITVPDDVLGDARSVDRWSLPRTLLDLAGEPRWLRPERAAEFADNISAPRVRVAVAGLPAAARQPSAARGRPVARRRAGSARQPEGEGGRRLRAPRHADSGVRDGRQTGRGQRRPLHPASVQADRSGRSRAGHVPGRRGCRRRARPPRPRARGPDGGPVDRRRGLGPGPGDRGAGPGRRGGRPPRPGRRPGRLLPATAGAGRPDRPQRATRGPAGRRPASRRRGPRSSPPAWWSRPSGSGPAGRRSCPAAGCKESGRRGVEAATVRSRSTTVDRMGLAAPARPAAALFRAAWQRVRAGDPPRLGELGRTR